MKHANTTSCCRCSTLSPYARVLCVCQLKTYSVCVCVGHNREPNKNEPITVPFGI